MDASIIWENPGLALLGVLGAIFLILLLPVVSALRRSREERLDASLRAREPGIREPSLYDDQYDDRGYDDRGHDNRGYDERQDYGSYFARYDDEAPAARSSSYVEREVSAPGGVFGTGPRKKKPARAAATGRSIWFLLGLFVGAGGLALWWNLGAIPNPLPTVLALFDRPDPPPSVQSAPPTPAAPADNKVQDRIGAANSQTATASAPVGVGSGEDVGELVEGFVSSLKAQLPMAVGPGITMVNVDAQGSTVALGFTIAQTVAAEDAPKLQAELETRFRSSVCATPPDPTNIHGLNDLGVAFLIDYVDLVGKNVAGLTVEPNFCT